MTETWRQRRYREQHPRRLDLPKVISREERRQADEREGKAYAERSPYRQNMDSQKR